MEIAIGILLWVLGIAATLFLIAFADYFDDRENFNYTKSLSKVFSKDEANETLAIPIILLWPLWFVMFTGYIIIQFMALGFEKLGGKLEDYSREGD